MQTFHLARGDCGVCGHDDVLFGERLQDGEIFFVCPACCAAGTDPPLRLDDYIPLDCAASVINLAPGGWCIASEQAIRRSRLSAFLGASAAVGYQSILGPGTGFMPQNS